MYLYGFCRISEYMDLSPAEVVGRTCYHFIHAEDLDTIRQSHEDCEPVKICVLFTTPSLKKAYYMSHVSLKFVYYITDIIYVIYLLVCVSCHELNHTIGFYFVIMINRLLAFT